MAPRDKQFEASKEEIEKWTRGFRSASTSSPRSPAPSRTESQPPAYYDSWPSSQPPRYPEASPTTPAQRPKPSPEQNQEQTKASVSAVLAYPTMPEEEKIKDDRSVWRRYSDWRKSWNIVDLEGNRVEKGSEPRLNYFGMRIDGGQTRSRVMRKG